ncbi:ABC transporter ATP-binding protein [Aminipila terrae]|uniref:ATP-binding cassette domain-containing protein n=1 Tax=Aminipila terrae TaxID=2697030 RepID=A0A6P1MER3_9FIRM|nr:ABC transporter ATP-binding protein [Aminipila terrae]QHI72397.1 ATP-binding cassette domain-containing protein [Aminipila terrae]
MEYAINALNITKKYKDFTLDNVSLRLPKGSIMGLIGENGAGKTTLIKLLLGLQKFENNNSGSAGKKSSSSITVLGHDIQNFPDSAKEDIGVVLDDCCFPEILNLLQIGKIMKSIYSKWDVVNFNRYTEYFNLPEKKALKDYSKGMKMKLSIAVALSHDAKLLILDEPTSGLDPVVRDEILDVFMDFIQDEEHSILISSHITSDLEKICDYITFINNGNIILSDVKDDILSNLGILKCSHDQLAQIDPSAIRGYKRNSFGVSALVDRHKVTGNFVIDPANLEEILLYSVRGK